MSDLPMKQEDHPAHDLPDATESYSGDEAPQNQMLRDRANRGTNAENIQANRNSDLRTRGNRGILNLRKALIEAP